MTEEIQDNWSKLIIAINKWKFNYNIYRVDEKSFSRRTLKNILIDVGECGFYINASTDGLFK